MPHDFFRKSVLFPLLGLTVLCLGAGSVHAREFSASYLLQMCASTKSGVEMAPGAHIACQSYLAGVIDYHVLLRSLGTAPSVDFCIPPEADLNLIQKVVTLYLMKNNQHADFVAAPTVALALYQTWPCKVQSKKKK